MQNFPYELVLAEKYDGTPVIGFKDEALCASIWDLRKAELEFGLTPANVKALNDLNQVVDDAAKAALENGASLLEKPLGIDGAGESLFFRFAHDIWKMFAEFVVDEIRLAKGVAQTTWMSALAPGLRVWWSDPDRGLSSGYYTVSEVLSVDDDDAGNTMLALKNDAGSHAEVIASELSPARPAWLYPVVDGDGGIYGYVKSRGMALASSKETFADPVMSAYLAKNVRLCDGSEIPRAWVVTTQKRTEEKNQRPLAVNDIVKFHTPMADEVGTTYRMQEVNGDRCIIELVCDMHIRPTTLALVADLKLADAVGASTDNKGETS